MSLRCKKDNTRDVSWKIHDVVDKKKIGYLKDRGLHTKPRPKHAQNTRLPISKWDAQDLPLEIIVSHGPHHIGRFTQFDDYMDTAVSFFECFATSKTLPRAERQVPAITFPLKPDHFNPRDLAWLKDSEEITDANQRWIVKNLLHYDPVHYAEQAVEDYNNMLLPKVQRSDPRWIPQQQKM